MALKRRVLTLDGAGRIALADEDLPVVEPGTVLVEVAASLVSPGTELGRVPRLREKPDPSAPARPFGYGNAGIVLDVGAGVGEGVGGIAGAIEPGLRVACMGAGYALHATHALVPVNLTATIPAGLSFDEAAFAHLAATALQAVRRGAVRYGHTVAVFGLGIVGQIACMISRGCGARVLAIDALPMRLEMARSGGADAAVNFREDDPVEAADELTRGRGVDVCIIAFGGDADLAIRQAVAMLKTAPDSHKMGVISIVGGARFTAEFPVGFGNVDVRASSRTGPGYHDEAWERGRDYPRVFVEWDTRRNMELLLEFIAQGRIDVSSLVTHRVSLEEAPAACEELIEHPEKALGVVIRP